MGINPPTCSPRHQTHRRQGGHSSQHTWQKNIKEKTLGSLWFRRQFSSHNLINERITWMGLWKETPRNSSLSCQMSQECLASWLPPTEKKRKRKELRLSEVRCCWERGDGKRRSMWFQRLHEWQNDCLPLAFSRTLAQSFCSSSLFIFCSLGSCVALFFLFLFVVHDGKSVGGCHCCKIGIHSRFKRQYQNCMTMQNHLKELLLCKILDVQFFWIHGTQKYGVRPLVGV